MAGYAKSLTNVYGNDDASTCAIYDCGLDFGPPLSDTIEYWLNRFLLACDSGLWRFERAGAACDDWEGAGGGDDEVINGCKGGWFGFAEGEPGEGPGDPVSGEAVDMTAVISTVAGDPNGLWSCEVATGGRLI